MQLSTFRRKNIFCIEGSWAFGHNDKIGIKSALDFLEHNASLKHIHKSCSSLEELYSLLGNALSQKHRRHVIIYLAFHGFPGELLVGNKQKVSLEEIAEMIGHRAKDKIIHFGSCSVLNVSRARLNKFLRETGALAVSGYAKDVEFIPSTFLDILYFQFCEQYKKIPLIHRDIKKYYGKMANMLGFKMYYQS